MPAFSLADFNAFLMDTPPVGGMSGSTPDNYLKVLPPTPSVNIAGDSATMADIRPDEHAIGPAVVTGASTTHTSPANLKSHGDVSKNTGLTSQLHDLARTLMLDDSPEQILIGIEVRLFFTLVKKLPLHQLWPILDSNEECRLLRLGSNLCR